MEVSYLKERIVCFLKDDDGLTVVEYAVAGGLISLAVVAAFTNLGTAVKDIIIDLTGKLPK